MAEPCDGFQHPLGGNVNFKKCMECGAITAHYGRHEKMAEQPTRISETDPILGLGHLKEQVDLDKLERLYNAPISSPLHRHVRKHLPALIAELRAARGLLAEATKYLREICEYEPDICVRIDRALIAKLEETK